MAPYPGLGLPLKRFSRQVPHYPIGATDYCCDEDSELITVREVAMMILMDSLTDKPDWHRKVFDEKIGSKWRREALEIPDEHLWLEATKDKGLRRSLGGEFRPKVLVINHLDGQRKVVEKEYCPENIMSAEAFDFCVEELRNKARYYQASGLTPTLNACSTVVKSDTLVSPELRASLHEAFQRLLVDQASSPDWHPNSGDMVQDLVHPSMYPLVYGRSGVFEDEVVGVSNAIEKYAGKGDVLEKDKAGPPRWGVPPKFWSDTYQWLPANVAFQDDGGVKFTSYINNLHPTKYPEIYRTIEKLIETVLPAWDQCLEVRDPKPRFPKPENPDDDNSENWDPSDPEAFADVEINWEELGRTRLHPEWDHDPREKWEALRKPVQPQPPPFKEVDYTPVGRIADKFKESDLQVIVKMASIELTPERPEFPVGGWHIEGQMNERICATILYYVDSENITTSSLSFCLQTTTSINQYNVDQDDCRWMEYTYGTALDPDMDAPRLQNYGSVETRQGRVLAFPNVFHHRVSPFRLADPAKPGHRRFVALWLVDPNVRIISTAKVPPQQLHWWVESALGSSVESREAALAKLPPELVKLLSEKGVTVGEGGKSERLPPEIIGMLRSHLSANDGGIGTLMSESEAKEHRLELMKERSAFHKDADKAWHQQTYNFCEH